MMIVCININRDTTAKPCVSLIHDAHTVFRGVLNTEISGDDWEIKIPNHYISAIHVSLSSHLGKF